MAAADWIPVMRDRIAEEFAPLRIILFGSHARGDARPDSDIDLLVVLPLAPNRRDAAVAIRRVLRDLPVGKDIIVTTPDEIRRRGDLIGTILRPALREGKVIYEVDARHCWGPGVGNRPNGADPEPAAQAMTDQSAALVAEWYRYAAEDLAAAEAWQAQPPAVPRHVCNMAQQSAEKALKACLIVAGIDFPKTHDLEQLRGLLPDVWPLKATLPQLAWLTDWAVDARSPSDVGEASDGDARRAVDEARQVWDAVSHELTGRNVQPPS